MGKRIGLWGYTCAHRALYDEGYILNGRLIGKFKRPFSYLEGFSKLLAARQNSDVLAENRLLSVAILKSNEVQIPDQIRFRGKRRHSIANEQRLARDHGCSVCDGRSIQRESRMHRVF